MENKPDQPSALANNQNAAKPEEEKKASQYTGRCKREEKAAWVACAKKEGYKNLNELMVETMNARAKKYLK